MRSNLTHLILLSALWSIVPDYVNSQSTSNSAIKIGLEVGGGYNQLFMSADSPGMHDRTAFSILPSARLNIEIPIFSIFSMYAFTGYNEFGGKDPGDYPEGGVKFSSQVKIQTLEFGLIGLFQISEFKIGFGTKYNHHLAISDRYEYFHSASADWDWRNYNTFFKDSSIDGGLRVEYLFQNRFTVGAESWIGLTDLHRDDTSAQNMNFRQNHFRLLFGYRL